MPHKLLKFIFVFIYLLFFSFVLAQTTAGDVNNVSGGNVLELQFKTPGEFIYNIYIFSLSIGGALAFGAIVYGGILRIAGAGNPSKISEANEWIKSALIGLILLLGVYFVLTLINPNLVKLDLPQLRGIGTERSGTRDRTDDVRDEPYFRTQRRLTESEARDMISRIGIDINANPPRTTLEGINIETIQAIALLKAGCNCYIKITGGTEVGGGHNPGVYSHANGYKADLSIYERDGQTINSSLRDYLIRNGRPTTRNNGGRIERGYILGNMHIFLEDGPQPHYDVVVYPRRDGN